MTKIFLLQKEIIDSYTSTPAERVQVTTKQFKSRQGFAFRFGSQDGVHLFILFFL